MTNSTLWNSTDSTYLAPSLNKIDATRASKISSDGSATCYVLPRHTDYDKYSGVSEVHVYDGARPHPAANIRTGCAFPRSFGGGLCHAARNALFTDRLCLQTQRTIAVIQALGAVAPAIVCRDVYYAGAKHLVPLLQLLIPGIDLVSLNLHRGCVIILYRINRMIQ